jgi:hypothetical protein
MTHQLSGLQHMQTISSAWTFSAKFIFPAAWISGFGLGAILDINNALQPPQLKFVFLVVWVLGSAFILWASAGLKRVRIAEHHLQVSNYVREICIPFTAITDVKQNRWINSRPITIYFRDATEFGDRVTFMPKQRFRILFWHVDPVVNELKQLAGLTG